MSTTGTRGGFIEGVENIDLEASASGCCGSAAENTGCCGESAETAAGSQAATGCCGESPAGSQPTDKSSSGCCG